MTQIRIAEKDPRKRGELFERMMGELLEKQGYDIKFNQVKPGYELDFHARHKHRGHEMIGECKAHKKRIDSPDLSEFFGKFTLERRANQHLSAEFYSLSPLTGRNGAEGLLEKIKEEEGIPFSVHTPEEIIDELNSIGILSRDIDRIKYEFEIQIEGISYVTNQKFHIDDILLEYFRGDYYWICSVSEPSGKKSFLLLDSTGSIPKGYINIIGAIKEHDESLSDRGHLFQHETLGLDSGVLLSVVAQLDKKENSWKPVFYKCIEILKNNSDYITIANIFIGIGPHCDEDDVFRKAEDIADILYLDQDEIDRSILLELYYYAQEGQTKLGNLNKAEDINKKICEIEAEIEAEKLK